MQDLLEAHLWFLQHLSSELRISRWNTKHMLSLFIKEIQWVIVGPTAYNAQARGGRTARLGAQRPKSTCVSTLWAQIIEQCVVDFPRPFSTTSINWPSSKPCTQRRSEKRITCLRSINSQNKPALSAPQSHQQHWNRYVCSNYSDLTRPHPKWWFSKGNPIISGFSRLVNYYNLARYV